MLSIAYGCSIGSLGTLVGGARNPLTVGFLSATQGINISIGQWMLYSRPVVLISIPIVWFILVNIFPPERVDISSGRTMMEKELADQGPMKRSEGTVLAILLATIVAWVLVSSLGGRYDISGHVGLAVVALVGAVALFLTGSLNFRDIEEKLPWGIILLYGGAITLGVGLHSSGAAAWLANIMLGITGDDPYLVIILLVITTISLTEMMSNTAAVATMLPIGMGIVSSIDTVPPTVAAMAIALSGGLAFMLVIATPGNAITYSSGYVTSHNFMKAGISANVVCILTLLAVAFVYWKLIGLW